jgi:methionyl-tRNA formyltransferase
MIFVGNGALLKNALLHVKKLGYHIDMVFCHHYELEHFFKINHIPFKIISDINKEISNLSGISEDKIIISINNGQLFRKEILQFKNFRFYNIHNGLLPMYRGMPEVCIIYSILNGEKEYGVSLHQIDEGIDTGKCFALSKFPVSSTDDFESIMIKSLQYCDDIFIENIDKIVHDKLDEIELDKSQSRLYSYKDLNNLTSYKNHPDIKRATKMGVFRLWFKETYKLIQCQIET